MKPCVAHLTDGRFSGATHGFMVGPVSPEAVRGGPIALVKDGDTIVFDVESRQLNVNADLSGRTANRPKRERLRGVMAKYAATVSSASEGAVTTPKQGD
jgi:dihydroxy-acid dehydratase